jgi:hypothetical protein
MSERPLVYIAHKLAGDWEANIADARLWVRAALLAGYAPVAPYLMAYDVLHEPEDRALGMEWDLAVLPRCDEIWLCGDTVSPGMQDEWKKAEAEGLRVRHFGSIAEVGWG